MTRAAAGPGRPRLAGAAFAGVGSPYLDGTFDDMVAAGEIAPIGAAVVETNRGCPFACTFCDWGQATQARIHELPGERVTGELTWLAERGVAYLYIVDANFGIRRRDVEITRAIGELARAHGAPRFVFFHLTKNATASTCSSGSAGRSSRAACSSGCRDRTAASNEPPSQDVEEREQIGALVRVEMNRELAPILRRVVVIAVEVIDDLLE